MEGNVADLVRAISDHAFFEQEPGTISGPFEGPLGYYLTYVVSRTPPRNELNPSEAKDRAVLERLYYRQRFLDYCNEVMAEADIEGLDSD